MNHLLKEYSDDIAKQILEKLHHLEVKEGDEGGTFKVIASTESIDRDGEVIKVNGRDTKDFMKNPVIIANHTYKIENIIGKATKIYRKSGELIVEGVFSKSNPLAVLAQNLYEEGMLKAVSVGFMVKGRNEQNREIIEKAELLELSFVAVQSNRDALSLDEKLYQKGVEMGLIQEVTRNMEQGTKEKQEQTEKEQTEKKEEEQKKEQKKEITLNDLMEIIHTIAKDVSDLKQQSMTNGTVKDQTDEKNFIAKETLQEINRLTSERLRELKKS